MVQFKNIVLQKQKEVQMPCFQSVFHAVNLEGGLDVLLKHKRRMFGRSYGFKPIVFLNKGF